MKKVIKKPQKSTVNSVLQGVNHSLTSQISKAQRVVVMFEEFVESCEQEDIGKEAFEILDCVGTLRDQVEILRDQVIVLVALMKKFDAIEEKLEPQLSEIIRLRAHDARAMNRTLAEPELYEFR